MPSEELLSFFKYLARSEAPKHGVTIVGSGKYCIAQIDDDDQMIPWICGFESYKDANVFMTFVKTRLQENERPKKQGGDDQQIEAILSAMMSGGKAKKSGPRSDSLQIFKMETAISDAVLEKLDAAFKRESYDPGV